MQINRIHLVAVLTLGCLVAPSQADFVKGVDLSSLQQIESVGGAFTELGQALDPVAFFADRGSNLVRIRLWHSPGTGFNDLPAVLQMAQRIKSQGMQFLLDIHYSDEWADPGNQMKPAAWATFNPSQLEFAVYGYTRDVITQLRNQGTLPEMVQIGNEISAGFLWPTGRVGGAFNANWPQFAELLKAGIAGVRDSIVGDEHVAIMLHYDNGGSNLGSRWFFDHLLAEGVEFDVIGLSFYNWWHGSLLDLQANLDDLAVRYAKPLVVVEAAYPFTLAWDDNQHNLIGLASQLHPGFVASPAGQRDFLCVLYETVRATPNGLGLGVVYWEPAWIAVTGFGSGWENLALFDFSNESLPAAAVFEKRMANLDLIDLAKIQTCMGAESDSCLRYDADCSGLLTVNDFQQLLGRWYHSGS